MVFIFRVTKHVSPEGYFLLLVKYCVACIHVNNQINPIHPWNNLIQILVWRLERQTNSTYCTLCSCH